MTQLAHIHVSSEKFEEKKCRIWGELGGFVTNIFCVWEEAKKCWNFARHHFNHFLAPPFYRKLKSVSSPANTPLNKDRKSKLPYSLRIDSFQLLKQFLGLAKSSIFLAPQGNRNIFIHPSEKSFLDIETFYCCNSFSLLFISSPIWINITQENATCKSSFFFYFTFFVRLRNGVDFAISRLLDYFYCFIACEKKRKWKFLHKRSRCWSDVA